MPLLPIDLQTLFGQAPQVGREQSLQRVHHQLAPEKAQYLVEQSEQRRELLGRLEAATRETGEITT